MKIAYLCDGLCKCSDQVGCYRLAKPGIDYCRHTFDERHAAYGKCEDPENYSERFHEIDLTDTETVWWEGDILYNDLAPLQ